MYKMKNKNILKQGKSFLNNQFNKFNKMHMFYFLLYYFILFLTLFIFFESILMKYFLSLDKI